MLLSSASCTTPSCPCWVRPVALQAVELCCSGYRLQACLRPMDWHSDKHVGSDTVLHHQLIKHLGAMQICTSGWRG